MQQPTIVLISPQLGENIGAAARAMANFGLSHLRIVTPRDGWPNSAARAVAAHGQYIIESAQIYDDIPSAIADYQLIYATTARRRDMQKSTLTAREFASQCGDNHNVKTAILFGRESSGLSNEEVSFAHKIITIPVADCCPSINLSQAVGIIAYEYFQQQIFTHFSTESEEINTNIASIRDINLLLAHLEEKLDNANFWKATEKKPRMWRNIRNIFLRNLLSKQEVQTLHGIINALSQ